MKTIYKTLALVLFSVSCCEGNEQAEAHVPPKSSLNYELNPEAEAVVLQGDLLTSDDCKRISKLESVSFLKLGHDLDGTYVQPGGFDALAKMRSLAQLELWLVNLGDHDLSRLNAASKLRKLSIGSGPYLYDRLGRHQPATNDNYTPVFTDELIGQLSKLKSIHHLELQVRDEEISDKHLAMLLKIPGLRRLTLLCSDLGANGASMLIRSNLEKVNITCSQFTLSYESAKKPSEQSEGG